MCNVGNRPFWRRFQRRSTPQRALRRRQMVVAGIVTGAVLLMFRGVASSQVPTTVPRLEPADCVTRELVEADAECYLFLGQEDRDDPNGTIVELPVAVVAPETVFGFASVRPCSMAGKALSSASLVRTSTNSAVWRRSALARA